MEGDDVETTDHGISIGDPNIYEVEQVLKRRTQRNKVQYFVKWKGFPENENSWVSDEDITPDLKKSFIEQSRVMKRKTSASNTHSKKIRRSLSSSSESNNDIITHESDEIQIYDNSVITTTTSLRDSTTFTTNTSNSSKTSNTSIQSTLLDGSITSEKSSLGDWSLRYETSSLDSANSTRSELQSSKDLSISEEKE